MERCLDYEQRFGAITVDSKPCRCAVAICPQCRMEAAVCVEHLITCPECNVVMCDECWGSHTCKRDVQPAVIDSNEIYGVAI